MSALLEISGLSLGYGPIRAVDDVSLTVGQNEIVAIIGGNGAGKTSLLKGIAGLLSPLTGSIHLDGRDITRIAAHQRVRSGIALSPEGRQVFPDQSVKDNLILGAYSLNLDAAALERDMT